MNWLRVLYVFLEFRLRWCMETWTNCDQIVRLSSPPTHSMKWEFQIERIFFYGKLCECVRSPFCVYVCSIVLEFSLYQSLWFSFEEVLMRVGYHHHQFISFTFNNDVGAVDEGREKNFCTNEFRILFFLQKVFMNTLSPNLMMIQLEINSNGMKTVNAHEEEFRLKK